MSDGRVSGKQESTAPQVASSAFAEEAFMEANATRRAEYTGSTVVPEIFCWEKEIKSCYVVSC